MTQQCTKREAKRPDLSVLCGIIYVDSAVDAKELARLVVELLQVFSVPVEIWSEEQVGPQVDTVSFGGERGRQHMLKKLRSCQRCVI